MNSTDAIRMRQKTQRLEIPDKPVSTSTLESVEAACRKFFAERGVIFRWTGCGMRLVRKEANGNRTREAEGKGQTVSLTIR